MAIKKKLEELKYPFELYIPTECKCGKPLPTSDRERVKDDAIAKMKKWFGANNFGISHKIGSWDHDDGTPAQEQNDVIHSSTNAQKYILYKEDFHELAGEIANQLTQAKVMTRISGVAFYSPSVSGPCIHDKKPSVVAVAPAEPQQLTEQDRRKITHHVLLNLTSLDQVRDLICNVLHYDYRKNEHLSIRDWPEIVQNYLAQGTLPQIIADKNDFKIVYLKLSKDRLIRSQERAIIERLVKDDPTLRGLMVVSDIKEKEWHLINVKFKKEAKSKSGCVLRRMKVGPKESMRTTVERLVTIDVEILGENTTAQEIQAKHDEAFDVQSVTRDFFRKYARVFEKTKKSITGFGQSEAEKENLHLFTQQLFNRLFFITFIQKKKWFQVNQSTDYLNALWEDYQKKRKSEDTFYEKRIKALFFHSLNKIEREKDVENLVGKVPYLNGGLFQPTKIDEEDSVKVPDESLGHILKLFKNYNFTVTESTPWDEEVAIDPEMLGTIFEELVTGRHGSGSYYTKKPVVSFMCQEALKEYLCKQCPGDNKAINEFIENKDPTALREPEDVYKALDSVTVCDPACGSGAYLLGMLQELLALKEYLWAAHQIGPEQIYKRKLHIIQQNLYGVDIDPFAVNIAKLRLWLSLAIDFDKSEPLPLPNLDYKIESGDSISGPTPRNANTLFQLERDKLIDENTILKENYFLSHGDKKKSIAKDIAVLENKIQALSVDDSISDNDFDWGVKFSEVFKQGGFDVVISNPPYVSHDAIARKSLLKTRYECYEPFADLFCYFIERGVSISKEHGIQIWITSNSFIRTDYGKPLRKLITTENSLKKFLNAHDSQLFEGAIVNVAIYLVLKKVPDKESKVELYNGTLDPSSLVSLKNGIDNNSFMVPVSYFTENGWPLEPLPILKIKDKIESVGKSLERSGTKIRLGLATGANNAFLLDRDTRDRILTQDPKSLSIIKPMLRGRDIFSYKYCISDKWLILAKNGVNIQKDYPAIFQHLNGFGDTFKRRGAQGQNWWNLRACTFYDDFLKPRIVWMELTSVPRFALCEEEVYSLNTSYFMIPPDDLPLPYLLGVLNSALIQFYMNRISETSGMGILRWINNNVKELPVPKYEGKQAKEIDRLARLASQKDLSDEKREYYKNKINGYVYQLYGLTSKEISLVSKYL
jgi:hypothetical protein